MPQLEFHWKYAAPLLSGLGRPDYGAEENWSIREFCGCRPERKASKFTVEASQARIHGEMSDMSFHFLLEKSSYRSSVTGLPTENPDGPENWERFYEQAWGHLANAGLTTVKSPLDLTRIKLRIAALGWIALDFVAASQQCEYANPFYWCEWIESLGIEPLSALITSIDEPEMREALSQHLDSSEIEIKEDENEGIFADDQELREELPNKIVAVAAEYQRQLVVNALAKGFGGEPELFLALYIACRDIQSLISDKESELEDELCNLREQFEDELNWLNAESVTDECNKNIERLRNEITCFESMLEHARA